MALSLAVQQQKSTTVKVLIVEDEGLIAAHISSLLKKSGYEVTDVSESSEEALASATRSTPDLILMDIRIKGEMDGIQTATKIREQLDVPVIFLTSHTDQETIQKAKMTGSAGFLTKPIHATTLSTAIDMGIFRYSAERELRQQRTWMKTLLSAVPEAIAVFDITGRIRFFSLRAEELTGWSQTEALEDHIAKVVPLTQVASGLSTNELYSVATHGPNQYRLGGGLASARFSGETFLIDGEISPSLDEGKVIGAVFRFREVIRGTA